MNKTLSLNRNLIKDGSSHFTLEGIIAAKPDEFAICNVRPRGGIQGRRSIEVDKDVVDAIRVRFGNMALVQAVRVMLGLPQKMAENAWQEEEDQLIRNYYPTIGGPPLAKVIDRSADCIRERASDLGVSRQWEYKRDRRAYNVVRRARAARARQSNG